MSVHQDLKADVLVIGGGASGIPAAIGAARAGARVVLIEEDAVVGGAPLDYYVDAFCGGPFCGIMKEAETILRSEFRLTIEPAAAPLFYLPDAWLKVFYRLLRNEKNITVITGARAVDVIRAKSGTNSSVTGVVVERETFSTSRVEGRVIIDATGCGAVALMAGAQAMYGRESMTDFNEPHAPPAKDDRVQDCTWMYFSQWLGERGPLDMSRLEHARLGVLINGFGYFHQDPERAMQIKPRIYLHWGCAVKCKDTRDPVELGKAQTEALKSMERDHALLRENGYAIYLAPRIGVRESNRIIGEQVVTENDLRSGKLPADTIAVGTYGLDIWGEDTNNPALESHTPGYGIPYRALVPKDVDGVLLAGRIISGTHVAMSAYRVMPIVGSIGQAAGVAAALCAKHRHQPREINPDDVRRILRGDKQNVQLEFHPSLPACPSSARGSPVACHREEWCPWLRRVPQRLDLCSQGYSGVAGCPAASAVALRAMARQVPRGLH